MTLKDDLAATILRATNGGDAIHLRPLDRRSGVALAGSAIDQKNPYAPDAQAGRRGGRTERPNAGAQAEVFSFQLSEDALSRLEAGLRTQWQQRMPTRPAQLVDTSKICDADDSGRPQSRA